MSTIWISFIWNFLEWRWLFVCSNRLEKLKALFGFHLVPVQWFNHVLDSVLSVENRNPICWANKCPKHIARQFSLTWKLMRNSQVSRTFKNRSNHHWQRIEKRQLHSKYEIGTDFPIVSSTTVIKTLYNGGCGLSVVQTHNSDSLYLPKKNGLTWERIEIKIYFELFLIIRKLYGSSYLKMFFFHWHLWNWCRFPNWRHKSCASSNAPVTRFMLNRFHF